MPVLTNARHEAFAQARAQGAMLDDAYEDAGFVLIRGHASRLASQPNVAERIAEIRTDEAAFSGASAQGARPCSMPTAFIPSWPKRANTSGASSRE